MYNRYIPQPDGSYKKSRLPEQCQPHRPVPPPKKKPEPCPAQEAPAPCPPPPPEPNHRCCPPKGQNNQSSISGFFKQLLPKELDTADLLIIILLLLMAGDCEEDRSNALLTLALYFLM